MTRRFSPLFAFVLTGFLVLATACPAQDKQIERNTESLPVEVALLYYKLLNQEPPYESLIFSNRVLLEKTEGFGQRAVIEQHHAMLEKMYQKTGKDSLVHASPNILITDVSSSQRSLNWNGVAPDLPLVFELSETERFGVFVRNAAEVATLAPPYEFDDFAALDNAVTKDHMGALPAELTLKPIAADGVDFKMGDGKFIHVILADLVEIKITNKTGRRVLLQKRFKNWRPAANDMDALFKSDLLPAP